MKEVQFIGNRQGQWERLKFLVDRSEAGMHRLTATELQELVRLYRRASGDLARVQSESSNADLEAFLNNLVARAYSQIYQHPRGRFRDVLRTMIRVPAQTIRRRAAFMFASLFTFLLGIAFSASVMVLRPDLRHHFVSPDMEPLFEQWKSGKFEEKDGTTAIAMTGFYSANNPRVALLASAASASTFGIGTAFILWSNGGLIGSLGTDMASVGKLGHLIVSVAPHGATEITAIIISGGAGYVLGWALIAPGRRTRGQALREAGKDAFVLLMLAFVMMFLAAPVEGFFSFNPAAPDAVKAIVAIVIFTAWMFYFVGFAREAEPLPQSNS